MQWLVLVALGLGGCGDLFGCGAPDEVEYTCRPLAAGIPGCVGGPTYFDDGHAITADTEQTFPDGCEATLPACDQFHPGAEVAVCARQDAMSFAWEILE